MRAAATALAGASAAALAVLAIACASVTTETEFDPAADFGAWRTYAWYPLEALPAGDSRLENPELQGRIEAAVDRVLLARGFTKVEDRAPDFYVNTHLSTEQRLSVRYVNSVYFSGPNRHRFRGAGWGGAGWGGPGWGETVVTRYEKGTLLIDLVDVATRRLAWRGSGRRRLSGTPTPDRVAGFVDQAVPEILAGFPPGP